MTAHAGTAASAATTAQTASRAPAPTRRRLLGGALSLAVAGLVPPPRPARALEEVPYVKTPPAVVEAILDLARVGPRDVLVDLGSGDGRIVIEAARRRGARGLGVEIDPRLVALARERAVEAGVADAVRFVQQDLFDTDLSSATVVTLYLLPDVNLALRPRLLALAPGVRIVSHDWDMGDWTPDQQRTLDVPDKPVGRDRRSVVHLWIVPAPVAGRWRGRIADRRFDRRLDLSIGQRYQEASIAIATDRGTPAQARGDLTGTALAFEATLEGRALRFEGEVSGERMEGTVEVEGRRGRWHARRLAP